MVSQNAHQPAEISSVDQPPLHTQTQNHTKWPFIIKLKKLTIFQFYILLFLACFLLIQRFHDYYTPTTIARESYQQQQPKLTTTTNNTIPYSNNREFPLICHPKNTTQTCPTTTNYPTKTESIITSSNQTCPDYFRWIHEDLKPWKSRGITREMVEAGKKLAHFRLVVLKGRVYVETYKRAFQTRDVFTVWGILQLLRFYPGNLPDLDLMFECDDKPVIKKSDYYYAQEGGNLSSSVSPPPMFHYCGDDESLDIPFPDWSFWGWHEINIKPWESLVEDIREGNQRVKWVDRVPYAYWKGNLHMGRRAYLLRCNSSQEWNAEIYAQRWALESRHGFRESNVADQCNYRYKIYMEGKAWSVSEKYIQGCDSMLLLIKPRYYEFFTRSLLPLKHYWPINPWKLCNSIKFAVDWGNNHPQKAQEIGKAGSKFVEEELKMKYIYDYMFHLLNEYGKLMKYKPTVPAGAVEVCSETMACNAHTKEKQWKLDSMVKSPSLTTPCTLSSPYDRRHLDNFLTLKENISRNVERWEANGNIEEVDLVR